RWLTHLLEVQKIVKIFLGPTTKGMTHWFLGWSIGSGHCIKFRASPGNNEGREGSLVEPTTRLLGCKFHL
ncbi:hypothetical protein HAX54_033052, partial [Datura stramonium]|nr:hypothetical protein [Datura stramonium]